MRKIFIFIVTIISFSASADVVVDLSKIKVGQYEIVNWNNLPVIVFHRTENQIQYLKLKIDRPTNTASESIYAKFYGEFIASALLEGDDLGFGETSAPAEYALLGSEGSGFGSVMPAPAKHALLEGEDLGICEASAPAE